MESQRKRGCCTTTGIINKFSRCLCLRLPDLKKLPLEKQRKIDEQMEYELYEA